MLLAQKPITLQPNPKSAFLNRQVKSLQPSALLFRQWSRKGSAVLISRKNVVHIGRLRCCMASALGQKTNPALSAELSAHRPTLFDMLDCDRELTLESTFASVPVSLALAPAPACTPQTLSICPHGTVSLRAFFVSQKPKICNRHV